MALMRSNKQFDMMNPEQRQSLDWTRSISVRANAGSGKTSVLIQRLVQILHSDFADGGRTLRLHQIVAITFTRKAAAQLREKFRQALVDCEEESTGEEKSYWRERIDELPACPIGTIDALVHRLLRAAIAEGLIDDLDPTFGVLQGMDRDEIVDQAIVRTEQEIEFADAPSRQAWANWLTTQGRWELTQALQIMLNSPFEPSECRRAVEAARERPAELPAMLAITALTDPIREFNGNAARINSTLHSIIQEIDALSAKDRDLQSVRTMREALSTIMKSSASVIDTLTQLREALLKKDGAVRTQGLAVKGQSKCPTLLEFQEHWQPLLAEWNFDAIPDNLDLVEQLVRIFAIAHRHFRDLCREENQFDFDFLARRLIEVLQRSEAQRLIRHFRFIMVDEFQDTNDLHWNLIARLAGEDPSKPVACPKLMIVGDPQQSIYRFRKADPTVFDRVQSLICQGNLDAGRHNHPTAHDRHLDLVGEDVERSTDDERAGLMRLRKNYRTTHEQPLRWIDQFSKTAFGEVGFDYQPLEPGLAEPSSAAECIYVFPDSAADEPAPDNGDEESASAIDVGQIQLVAEELHRQRTERGFAWKEMAILLRSRNELLTNLEKTFREHKIPFQIIGGIGFWQRQEVRDMVSLARCLANAADEMALFAVLRGPLAGLDDSEILFLATLGRDRLVRGLRLLDLLDDSLQPRGGISDADRDWADKELSRTDFPKAALRAAFDGLERDRKAMMRTAARRLGYRGLWRQRVDRMAHANLLRQALDESEAWVIYAAETDGDRCVANLRLLLDQVRELDANHPGSLAEMARRLTRLVDEADREEQAEIPAPGGDAVQVMTVHAAKGLEFPVVAVVGLERKFRTDSSPVYLLDRHQHFQSNGADPDLATRLHGLPVISFRDPEHPLRKFKPLLHQALRAIERQQSRMEEARILHVAITRAQKVLILAGAAEWKENCWQSWVHAALDLPDNFVGGPWRTPGSGMPQVRIVRRPSISIGPLDEAGPEALPVIDLELIQESPRTRTIAATALFRMLSDFERDPTGWRMHYLHQVRADISPLPTYLVDGSTPEPNENAGALIGTLVHRALELKDIFPSSARERSEWLHAWALGLTEAGEREDGELESNGSLRRLASEIADGAARILRRILAAKRDGLPEPFANLIDAPGDAEVDFVLAIGGWRITGRFDRLISRANHLPEIVDWKTDSEPIEQIKDTYRNQMMLYALALLDSRPAGKHPDGLAVHLAMTAHETVHTFRFQNSELQAFRRNLEERLGQLPAAD